MVKIPEGIRPAGSARETCVKRFREWWSDRQIWDIMAELDPGIRAILPENGNMGRVSPAEILYDMVGPRFLRSMDDTHRRKLFLEKILDAAIKGGMVREKDIMETAARSGAGGKFITSVFEVPDLRATRGLCVDLARTLGLPPSVAHKERREKPPKKEIIEPHAPLNPLYDYQYTTGIRIRGMLEGKIQNKHGRDIKRQLIVVPTGSGKTRMTVQAIIEWLNDGKPSKNPQQKNSKFVLWVAQSTELCEQAFSTFRSIFESVGRRGTTLHIHRAWGSGGSLPPLEMDDLLEERGVIVATIQSLYKILSKQPSLLEKLSELTSCIVVDEAHHAVAMSYSRVLSEMGFNWHNRSAEISEKGIVLIGLTATPFRGSGDGEDTIRLKRWYGGVHFPHIPFIDGDENYRPHALIDCQPSALVGEDIHILGERSYDRDGFIRDTDYFWSIRRLGPAKEDAAGSMIRADWARRDEWTSEGSKNVTFKFRDPGRYEIGLTVIDNEGDSGDAKTQIVVRDGAEEEVSDSEKQKSLYRKLIKRKVLCEVYHHVLSSTGTVDLDAAAGQYLKDFGEFKGDTLRSIGERRERNLLIMGEIMRLNGMGRKKILFFGCTVEHSRLIAIYLRMSGIKARYVDSMVDVDSRVAAIESFRNGDLEVLCNFDVLTTGFDAPNIDCVFVGRPVKSTLLYTQMIGRGMRGTKSGGTKDVLVVDIDDNFQLQEGDVESPAVELGWKIFAAYWKKWEEPGDALSEPGGASDLVEPPDASERAAKAQEDVVAAPPVVTPDVEYACSGCGRVTTGADRIMEVFGLEGPIDILVEYIRAKRYDSLPTKCHKCRTGAAPGNLDGSPTGVSGYVKGAITNQTAPDVRAEPVVVNGESASEPDYNPPENGLTPEAERLLQNRFDMIIKNGPKGHIYKFALAAHLLHHLKNKNANPTIPYGDIAAAFLKYYWHQEIKYGIRQNRRDHATPRAIKIIRKTFRGCMGNFGDMPQSVVDEAAREIAKHVLGTAGINGTKAIRGFQMPNNKDLAAEDKMFFEYSEIKKTITLRAEAMVFLRKNRVALLGRVFEEWAGFLESLNTSGELTAKVQRYLDRHGAHDSTRIMLDDMPFDDSGPTRCFRCGINIGRDDPFHVEHLVPWSYIFESEGWSPIRTCSSCHSGKSNLPYDRTLIGRLARNDAGA